MNRTARPALPDAPTDPAPAPLLPAMAALRRVTRVHPNPIAPQQRPRPIATAAARAWLWRNWPILRDIY